MRTNLQTFFKSSADIREAETILRSCVHCGFCNATCPTYGLLADERDGPRGRIYLIKQLLEEGTAGEGTRRHLDRCLSCGSCETTCPSGVRFRRLLDIGRHRLEGQSSRAWKERLWRWGLLQVLPYPLRFRWLMSLAHPMRVLLPKSIQEKIPVKEKEKPWPQFRHSRVMLALPGCVQSVATPNTNGAAARVLDRLGISLQAIKTITCCGAMNHHLSDQETSNTFIRKNIDAWWPAIEEGAEAIVITASGCGTFVKEYGQVLKDDPVYAQKAQRVSELAKDISEVLMEEDLSSIISAQAEDVDAVREPLTEKNVSGKNVSGEKGTVEKVAEKKVAVHCPCSLQHGQQLPHSVAALLDKIGVSRVETKDDHLCCGSAGSYSILQPELSQRLLTKKIKALMANKPDQIVTANVGCQLHLQRKATVPVRHWVELLDSD